MDRYFIIYFYETVNLISTIIAKYNDIVNYLLYNKTREKTEGSSINAVTHTLLTGVFYAFIQYSIVVTKPSHHRLYDIFWTNHEVRNRTLITLRQTLFWHCRDTNEP